MFHNILTNNFEKSFPIEKVHVKYNNKHEWIIQSITKKNSLFYLSKNNSTEENITVYKTYKNKLTTISRKSERDYFCSELESSKDDLKNQQRILKSITCIKLNQPKHSQLIVYEERTITDLTEIAEIYKQPLHDKPKKNY